MKNPKGGDLEEASNEGVEGECGSMKHVKETCRFCKVVPIHRTLYTYLNVAQHDRRGRDDRQ